MEKKPIQVSEIYKIIRREDAILWIGSGFSIYGGYPAGKTLVDKIYQSISKKDKKDIGEHDLLTEVTEQLVRLYDGDRGPLIRILDPVFRAAPKSLEYHSLLLHIPHIKTIVTTNYDRLLELAYGGQANTIIKQADIASIDKKPAIFKIHGDRDNLASAIITKSDYTGLYASNFETSLLWSVIKERIATKTVIFIGYGLEDPNVEILFKRVSEALGASRKPVFFVAPDVGQSKINHLSMLGIEYVKMSGERFVEELYQNVCDNIFKDITNRIVSPNTFMEFVARNNLQVQLQNEMNDRYRVTSIAASPGSDTRFSFGFTKDGHAAAQINNLLLGESFEDVTITNKTAKDFSFKASGINLISDENASYSFFLSIPPTNEGLFDIRFEDDFELSGIAYKFYVSAKKFQIKSKYKDLRMEISGMKPPAPRKVSFNFNQDVFRTVNDGIETHSFLKKIAEGRPFTLYVEGGNKFPISLPSDQLQLKESDFFVEYFNGLKEIEKTYQVRFTNITELSDVTLEQIRHVLKFSNHVEVEEYHDAELSYDLQKIGGALSLLKSAHANKTAMVAQNTEMTEFNIHGQKIVMGYRTISLLQLCIVNIDEIEKGIADKVVFKSRINKRTIQYSQNRMSPRETTNGER